MPRVGSVARHSIVESRLVFGIPARHRSVELHSRQTREKTRRTNRDWVPNRWPQDRLWHFANVISQNPFGPDTSRPLAWNARIHFEFDFWRPHAAFCLLPRLRRTASGRANPRA